MLSKNLENREEKEKWKYNSPARERKTWVISSRDFLEIETLVNDCIILDYMNTVSEVKHNAGEVKENKETKLNETQDWVAVAA